MKSYEDFIASKAIRALPHGFKVELDDISPVLFEPQRDIVKWAVWKGRAAIFADTGLGKTLMGLEFCRLVNKRTLIIAPLAVCRQIIREAKDKLDLHVEYIRSPESVVGDNKLWITNREMVKEFSPKLFECVWLDESSILKNISGTMSRFFKEFASSIDYRLCTTATPAPNDTSEIGNHSEFLGVKSATEMASIFFVHDAGVFRGAKTGGSRWRLKRHATESFYRWMASWAMTYKRPSDLGYSDDGFALPEKQVEVITVDSDITIHKTVKGNDGQKYEQLTFDGMVSGGLSSANAKKIRRGTITDRLDIVTDLANSSDEQWIIWCDLNDEAIVLNKALDDSVNVHGSLKPEQKADHLIGFVNGDFKVLISKASIAGFGLNMQNCHNMIFFGIDYSWEQYYQAVRRIWRFGQKEEVNIYIVLSEQSRTIFDTIQLKERKAVEMTENLIKASRAYTIEELHEYHREWEHNTDETIGKNWTMWLGDSCERMKEIDDNSVHISVYSPPFSDLYVYSDSERDLSNSVDYETFMKHYQFIIEENLRITIPGRVACVHVQDIKQFKNRVGHRGLKDFAGDVIKAYVAAGWIFRSCVTVSKNPQIVASRNKDTDLLFVTGKRDSTDLAPVPPDYLLIFKKPGTNPVPVLPYEREVGAISENDWIEWAYPCWYDIKETEVLNVRQAKGNEDEKHMCPLQLPLIARCVRLFSNAGELVFSPFAGIGSEGYEALRWRNRFLGIELKPEYYKVACQNLRHAENFNVDLFTYADTK